MNCTESDNRTVENEVLCPECDAKENSINEEQPKSEEPAEEDAEAELASAESGNPEEGGDTEKQDAAVTSPDIPSYVPAASHAYDGFPMNRDTEPHEKKKKGFDPALVKKMQAQLKPLSTWGFIWREAICFIPLISLAFLFVLAFADGVNLNSRSFARSRLIRYLIYTVVMLAALILYFIFRDEIMDTVRLIIDNLYNYIHTR